MKQKNNFEVTPLSAYDEKEFDLLSRMVPMRDGRKLNTLVFLPKDNSKPLCTCLFRTPYLRREYLPMPFFFALKMGFAAVFQHCRGTGTSEGEFYPNRIELETNDGEDTLDWIVKQPWSNGKVVLMGSSYSGWTQWAAAFSGHPALAGFRPHVAALYGCLSMVAKGGVSYLGFIVNWGLTMYHRNMYGYENVPDYDASLAHLPVSEMDVLHHKTVVNYYWDFIDSARHPSKVRKIIREKFRRITVPALISGGWFDPFKDENFESFKLMRELAATPEARQFTRLIMGPWVHGGLLNKEIFGEENDYRELTKMQDFFTCRSFEYPGEDPLPDVPAVQYFMLGENRWRSSETWPPAGKEKSLYLADGAGLAEQMSEGSESCSSYVYDPADPTPSYDGTRHHCGYFDFSATEKRKDLLTFTGGVLEKPLSIAGNVKLRLFARSSAPDTDFFATLTDVYPDGRSMFLTSGMIRARYSCSEEQENFLKPGEIREYLIDVGEIANTFAAGHRVRVTLHSASFPAFSRNLNTETAPCEGVNMTTAFQEIFHDSKRPSALLLPELI